LNCECCLFVAVRHQKQSLVFKDDFPISQRFPSVFGWLNPNYTSWLPQPHNLSSNGFNLICRSASHSSCLWEIDRDAWGYHGEIVAILWGT
jgi:hypothetical protein